MSEQSVAHEKTLNKSSSVPISDLHSYIQRECVRWGGTRGKKIKMEKNEKRGALAKRQPTEGTSLGLWCVLGCCINMSFTQ